jgi:hypothetical protein
MQRLLRAGRLIVASAIATVPIEAQNAPRAEIVAPAPLTLPLVRVSAEPRPATRRIHWHSYEGSGTRSQPSLWVVNGTPLGLRSDGSIDQEAAQRDLRMIRCRDIVSIDVLRGAAARTRFGPNVPDGVVILVTRSPGVGDEVSERP